MDRTMGQTFELMHQELAILLDAIDAAPWREAEGERIKLVCFAPTAIERIRSLHKQSY